MNILRAAMVSYHIAKTIQLPGLLNHEMIKQPNQYWGQSRPN
jgi:hypothetical protein